MASRRPASYVSPRGRTGDGQKTARIDVRPAKFQIACLINQGHLVVLSFEDGSQQLLSASATNVKNRSRVSSGTDRAPARIIASCSAESFIQIPLLGKKEKPGFDAREESPRGPF